MQPSLLSRFCLQLFMLFVFGPSTVGQAEEPLLYEVEVRQLPQIIDGAQGGGQGFGGRFGGAWQGLQVGGFVHPVDRPKQRSALALNLRLQNVGTTDRIVHWPDARRADVFQFQFVHVESGQRLPVESLFSLRERPPTAAPAEEFRRLAPGQMIEQTLQIGAGLGFQAAIPRTPGTYELIATLHQHIDHSFDEGTLDEISAVWIGAVQAAKIKLDIETDLESSGKTISLAGHVQSHDGESVPNAKVELRYSSAPGASFAHDASVTWETVLANENGSFHFTGVPDECDYQLIAQSPDYRRGLLTYSHNDYLSNTPMVVRLPQTYPVRGVVTDRGGRPLPQVRVNSNCYTDAEGKFELQLPQPHGGDNMRLSLWRRDLMSDERIVSWQDATSSDLQVTMFRREELSVRGQALSVDDQPMGKVKLTFKLSTLDGQSRLPRNATEVHSETDDGGNFTLVLPGYDTYRAVVHAEEEVNSGAGRRWTCEVERLRVGEPLLIRQFDNRGRMLVRIFHESKPDPMQQLVITVYSITRNKNIVWERMSASEAGRVYAQLEPGEYRVTARIEEDGHQEIQAEVKVPDTEPYRALAVMRLPKLHYGQLEGQLVQSDGQTPATGVPVNVYSAGATQTTVTDEHGRFDFTQVIAGQVSCWIPPELGVFIKAPVSIHVIADETTDAGNLVLASPVGWGTVSASLRYPDGNLVRGQTLVDVFSVEQADWMGSSQVLSNVHAFPDVTPAGIKVRAGDATAVIEHHGTAKSRTYISGGLVIPPEYRRFYYTPVQVAANQHTHIERVVQRRADARDLSVRWDGNFSPQIAVIVPQGDQACWVYEGQHTRMVVDDDGNAVAASQHMVFDDIQSGPGWIVVDAWQAGFVTVLPLSAEGDEQVEIDTDTIGSLDVVVRDPAGQCIPNAQLSISQELPFNLTHWIGSFGPNTNANHSERAETTPAELKEDLANATLLANTHIPGLGPGTYRLSITTEAPNQFHGSVAIELKAGEHRSIVLQFDAEDSVAIVPQQSH
ncbi:MAG: hypothetical protein KDB22_24900 [Planctomycetales bacterium]|nr:hypothetical protein [Planctomycetales bacterium]